MKNSFEYIDDLIIQYYNGTIDSEGVEDLLVWVEKDPENKGYFKEQLNLLKSVHIPDADFDAEKAWSAFGEMIERKPPASRLSLYRVLAIAASVGLIVIFGRFLFDRTAGEQVEFVQYRSEADNLTEILEDDSRITLSKNSIIYIPDKFSEKNREVQLEGKAFFEIAKDEKRPFVVICQDIMVAVLGTSFEIDMDTLENQVMVAVLNGEVSVSHNSGGPVTNLRAGEQFTVSQEGIPISERTKINENILSWKTGVLTFNNVRMDIIALELEEYYGTKIIFEQESLKNEFVTIRIDNQPISEVGKTLELILGATISEHDGEFIIGEKH